jgi:glyceraldehyde 3-phosphate dehydrogenase
MKKVAINGFGRIGRAALKVILEATDMEVIAVNDLLDIDNAAYLLRYDSVYGRYDKEVRTEDGCLYVGNQKITYLSEKDPARLPWKQLGVEVVIESTGVFTSGEDAEKHITAGASYVVISAPAKSVDTPTVVHGVNAPDGKMRVFSCASCTTNNVSPVIEILGRRLGIKKAILSTVHAYTATQSTVDGPSKKKPRMGRAAAVNLIPATTGAAVATVRALPQYDGKFDGIAIRTPVVVGSISDITFLSGRPTTVEEVNQVLREEASTDRYREVVSVSDDPLVSTDIIQSTYASIVDAEMTRVVDGDLVKVLAWYDNEWGFTNQMIRQIGEL